MIECGLEQASRKKDLCAKARHMPPRFVAKKSSAGRRIRGRPRISDEVCRTPSGNHGKKMPEIDSAAQGSIRRGSAYLRSLTRRDRGDRPQHAGRGIQGASDVGPAEAAADEAV